LIQQLQDEISRLRHTSTQINVDSSNDNDVNYSCRDNTVVELQEQLRKAAMHIKQLARDRRVLIEVGNRLRAELLRNGKFVSGAGRSHVVFHQFYFSF